MSEQERRWKVEMGITVNDKKYSEEHQVSDNMTLFKEYFGNFNVDVVSDLLAHVDIWLAEALGLPHFSSRKVYVIHVDDNPKCATSPSLDVIMLATEGDFWCQWVYQFAHEYCHHLIADGPYDEGPSELLWFEETICELSSMYCLHRMIDYCLESPSPSLRHYAPSVQGYLVGNNKGQKVSVPLHSYIEERAHLMSRSDRHREMHTHIAGEMLPLFLQCPYLWRMILHFGDMSEWHSLSQLFDHLREEADATYAASLEELRSLLLGS